MKLTNILRDEFIDSVINSLPKVDYISKVQELLNKDAFDNLPEVLKNKDIQHFLKEKRIYFNDFKCLGAYYVRNIEYEPSDDIKKKINTIYELHAAQRENKKLASQQLRAIIYGVTTLAKAKEFLPEDLHKYLPKEKIKDDMSTKLVTNELMDSLVSLGFKK